MRRTKVFQGLTTYHARHTWASIAFNLGIQKDVVSLALGHSFGVRLTDTYINADLSRVYEANRMVMITCYTTKNSLIFCEFGAETTQIVFWDSFTCLLRKRLRTQISGQI